VVGHGLGRAVGAGGPGYGVQGALRWRHAISLRGPVGVQSRPPRRRYSRARV
jgi:hypothetical protein